MILRALIYAIAVFALTGVIALIVAGIIFLLYRSIRRNETKKELDSSIAKPSPADNPVSGKERV